MNVMIRVIAVCLVVALSGCCPSSPPPRTGPSPWYGRAWYMRGGSMLGLASGSECPAPGPSEGGVWTVRPVSPVFRPLVTDTPPKRLCKYQWISRGGRPDDTAIPRDKLEQAGPDLPAMTTLTSRAQVETAFKDAVVQALHDRFLSRARELGRAPKAGGDGPLRRVEIGFADTSPNSSFKQGRNTNGLTLNPDDPHGFNMAAIALAMTYYGDDYFGHVITRQALPFTGGEGMSAAGAYGTRGDLAAAIIDLVEEWNPEDPDHAQHLVINLSVAWEPRYGCEPSKAFQAPGAAATAGDPKSSPQAPGSALAQQSVFSALQFAVCKGALVIVAAGNDPGYSDVSGPMCPAKWESEPAPDPTACAKLFPELRGIELRGSAPAAGAYRPLVHAVGGVGYHDEKLPTGRDGGRPRLAALGEDGMAGSDKHMSSKDALGLTGTSISAAVVSGIAAAVWAYRPSLGASEVMDFIYQSGAELYGEATAQPRSDARGRPLVADFCLGSTSPCASMPIRRVSLRRAIMKACAPAEPKERCPVGDIGAPLAAPDHAKIDPGALAGFIGLFTNPPHKVAATDIHSPAQSPPEPPFPTDLYNVTRGQPNVPACPACTLTAPSVGDQYSLYVLYSADYFAENEGARLSDMRLNLYSSTGGLLTTITGLRMDPAGPTLPDPNLGDSNTFTGPAAPTGTPASATLTWSQTFDGQNYTLVTETIRLVVH